MSNERFENIEHELWHLVEGTDEIKEELKLLIKLFSHIYMKDIPTAWLKMYKLTAQNETLKKKEIDLAKSLLEKNGYTTFFREKSKPIKNEKIDVDRILEFDFIRWILRVPETCLRIAIDNVLVDDLKIPEAKKIYETILSLNDEKKPFDALSLSVELDDQHYIETLQEILSRKITTERAIFHMQESTQRILDRNWMEKREKIKLKIQSGNFSDQEELDLVAEFDLMKRNPPGIKLCKK